MNCTEKHNNIRKMIAGLVTLLVILPTIILGNNPSGPAGIGNSDGSNGQPRLVIWYDVLDENYSNGDKVNQLTDKSGNNNHAIQPSVTNRPVFQTNYSDGTFHGPVVTFSRASQQFMPIQGNVIAGTDYTFSFVGGRTSDNNMRVFVGGTNAETNKNLHLYFKNSSHIHYHQYGNDLNGSMVSASHNGGKANGTLGSFSFVLKQADDMAGRWIYQNDDLVGSNTSTNYKKPLISWDGAAFGRNLTDFHDIVLSEVMVYSTALNPAQITILNNYIHTRHGILVKNIRYSAADPSFIYDLTGIGTHEGTYTHQATTGNGGGIFLMESNQSLSGGTEKFVFAAHNNATIGETINNLPAGNGEYNIEVRSTREWYIQRTGNNLDIEIGFNLDETGVTAGDPNQVYFLIWRNSLTDNFTIVPNAQAVAENSMVWFQVADNAFEDGYFTIARSDLQGRTWYSYRNGSWDDFRTWSLEQGGADIINPGQHTPSTSPTSQTDRIVINAGHRVTLLTNNKSNMRLSVENGILDLASTTGHQFKVIDGSDKGTIRMRGIDFPKGNASQFFSLEGGTLELNGATRDLTGNYTFNNLRIKLAAAENSINMLGNINLNGSLIIENGAFIIGSESNTQALTLAIDKNLQVERNGKLLVGTGNTASNYSIKSKMPALGRYHSIYHNIEVGGSLTNDGTMRLTNQDAPHYGQFTYTGAANFTFTKPGNQFATLNGVTDFYNLIIDKGTDKTFVLEIYSDNYDYFRLFGPNNVGRLGDAPYTDANPEIRKALWIKNGTLKLTGMIHIPSLSEGNTTGDNGDYAIPANGALWIAGAEVKVFTTAHTSVEDFMPGTLGIENGSSHQALSVMGNFKISDGYFSTRNSAGFIFWASSSAVVEIEGGICDVAQFRNGQSTAGRTVFRMTDGELIVRAKLNNFEHRGNIIVTAGGEPTDSYPIFGMVDPEGAVNISGGDIYIYDNTGDNTYKSNAIYINVSPANHNITGGTIHLIGYNTNENFDIYTTGNLYSLNINQVPSSGNKSTKVYMGTSLELDGDLTIGTRSSLYSSRSFDNFRGAANDLTIARNFILQAGSRYFAGDNTTTLLVTGNTNTYIYEPEINFYNLVIAPNAAILATQRNINHTGTATVINVFNDLTIASGATLRHHNQIIFVRGNIENSGTIVHQAANSTGKIVLSKRGIVESIEVTSPGSHSAIPAITLSAPQLAGGQQATAVAIFSGVPKSGNVLPLAGIMITNPGSGYTSVPEVTISTGEATATAIINTQHVISGNGNGVFSSLEVNEPFTGTNLSAKFTSLEANQTVSGTMTLTDGIFDLANYKLIVNGKLSTQGTANEETLYSETRMFRMNGSHGGGGLTLAIKQNGTYVFPIGTYNPYVNANRYAFARQTYTNVTTPGSVQINSIPAKLPTLSDDSNPNQRRYLNYYWRVRHTFAEGAKPFVHNTFRSYADDYFSGQGNVNFSLMIIGKVVNDQRIPGAAQADNYLGTLDEINSGDNYLLNYSLAGTLLEEGEFTSGRKQMFEGEITVFYNRVNLSSTSYWDVASSWSTVNHTSSTNTAGVPGIGDIVNISNSGQSNGNHYIWVRNNIEVAKVNFSNVGSGWGARMILQPSVRASVSIVEGQGGQIGFEISNSGMSRLEGDLSGFNQYPASNQVIYFLNENNNNPIVLPGNLTEFPSVRIHGTGGNNTDKRIASFPVDVVIHGSLRIDVSSTLRLHNGEKGDIHVKGNVTVGPDNNGGRLEFPTSGYTRKFTVDGNITVGGNSSHNGIDSEIRVLNNTPSGLKHQLEVKGNIILTRNGKINLFTNNTTTGNNVSLILSGNNSTTFAITETTGNPYASLYNVEINKGSSAATRFSFNSPFAMGATTNGAEKALKLTNGAVVLNHNAIDIVLSSGGDDFVIGGNAGLIIERGIARITTPGSNGIALDGLIEVRGPDSSYPGQLILNGGAGSDNYIAYSASGRAVINIVGGTLMVGSQIRGSLDNDSGILSFSQLNASGYATARTIIGMNSAPVNTRGVFEIHNHGSRFRTYSGTITIVRGHDVPGERAALFLNPATSGLNEWGALQIGDGTTESTITFNADFPLASVTVKSNTTLQTHTNHFETMGNLTIEANAVFNGNNLNATIGKNLINRGETSLNTDTLFLAALTEQFIDGNVTARNLVVNPVNRTWMKENTSLQVTGSLNLTSGTLDDNGNKIYISGDVTNNGTHISGANGMMVLNGTTEQRLGGTGSFGNLEINNLTQVRLQNNISLNNKFVLTNGIFNIGSHRLSLGTDVTIEGDNFSSGKMIATSGSIADKGILRMVNSGASTHEFPLGVISGTENKYTPVTLQVAANSSNGSVRINPVNQLHMTATGINVLKCFWIVDSEGLNNMNAEMKFSFPETDVEGSLVDYYTARLVNDGWQKLNLGINTEEKTATFYFGGVNSVSGDYTAGIDAHIPAQIPVFISDGDGNWTNLTNWTSPANNEIPSGGPHGHIVIIREGDHVNLDRFRVLTYRTEIYGTLDAGDQSGHNLGRVSGTGTLVIPDGKLPAGIYNGFFQEGNNSTVVFDGTEEYIIPELTQYGVEQNAYNNLVIRGSGEKVLPFSDFSIRNNLTVESGATLSSRATQRVYLAGNLMKENGATLKVDYLGQRMVMNGSQPQTINGNFTGTSNHLRSLEVANAAGVTIENPVELNESLILNSGILTTGANTLTVKNHASNAVSTSSGYVDGTLSRRLISSSTNTLFPIGNEGVRRDMNLYEFTAGYWAAQYHHQDPNQASMPTDDLVSLAAVGNAEYWTVEGPSGGNAKMQLSWGQGSSLPEVAPSVLENYIAVAQWIDNNWVNKGNASANANGNGTGYVRASIASSPVLTKTGKMHFTLASTDADQLPLPIDLISFTAKANNDIVVLEWLTASEINNNFFTIERTVDGKSFEIIAVIASQAEYGNSNTLLSYNATDMEPLDGKAYYRLKQTDFDGAFTYSELVAVEFGQTNELDLMVYPNPNPGNSFRVLVNGFDPFEASMLQVTDFTGRNVYTEQINADDNGNLMAYVIPNGRLNSGVYVVTVSGTFGQQSMRMVVSQ